MCASPRHSAPAGAGIPCAPHNSERRRLQEHPSPAQMWLTPLSKGLRRSHLMLGVAAAGSGMTVARVEVSADEHSCGIDPLVNVCPLRAAGRSFTRLSQIGSDSRPEAARATAPWPARRYGPSTWPTWNLRPGRSIGPHGPRPPDWGEEKIAASGRPMPLRQNAGIDESSINLRS
jgi:hypothetical protein